MSYSYIMKRIICWPPVLGLFLSYIAMQFASEICSNQGTAASCDAQASFVRPASLTNCCNKWRRMIKSHDFLYKCLAGEYGMNCESASDNVLHSVHEMYLDKRVRADFKNPLFNPLFSRENQGARAYAVRLNISREAESTGYSINPIYQNSSIFALTSEARSHLKEQLGVIQNYLDTMEPDDTAVIMYSGFLSFRLGDYGGLILKLQNIIKLVDIQAPAKCQVASSWYIKWNSSSPKTLSKKERDRLSFIENTRDIDCINLLNYRSEIGSQISFIHMIKARDDPSTRLEHTIASFKVISDDLKFGNDIEKEYIIPTAVSPKYQGLIIPFLSQSLLRHHMQQFEYLYNESASTRCIYDVDFRSSIQEQHGSCEAAKEKFLQMSNSYRDLLREIAHTKEVLVIEDRALGLKSGVSRTERDEMESVFLDTRMLNQVKDSIFRLVHSSTASNAKLPSGVFDKANPNWRVVNQEWIQKNASSVLVIDDVFTAAGLQVLRNFSLEHTMWNSAKLSGYICAFLEDGWATPIIAQAAVELQELLPDVICSHILTNSWGYVYPDGDLSDGIAVHADYAAVNVNCWTTPDEHIEEGTGGMIVWTVKPPEEWDSATKKKYNGGMNEIRQWIDENGKYRVNIIDDEAKEVSDFVELHSDKKVVVEYKANRCVIFESSYLHATDKVRFAQGFDSRRINLTFLYGKKYGTCADAEKEKISSMSATRLYASEK